jgi:hypothetical protein
MMIVVRAYRADIWRYAEGSLKQENRF